MELEKIKESQDFKDLFIKCLAEDNKFWYGVVIHLQYDKLQRCRVSKPEIDKGLHNISTPIVAIKYKNNTAAEILKWY